MPAKEPVVIAEPVVVMPTVEPVAPVVVPVLEAGGPEVIHIDTSPEITEEHPITGEAVTTEVVA